MRWFDAQGGHLEDEGIFLDQNKNPIVDSVPQHRHHVVLNIYRVDLGLKYILGTNWIVEFLSKQAILVYIKLMRIGMEK